MCEVDSRIGAGQCGQRMGGPVRRSTFLTAAVAAAAMCVAAVPAVGGAAITARPGKAHHRLCTSFFSIGQITGLGTKLGGKVLSTNGRPHGNSYWRSSGTGVVPEQGNLPGSDCAWIDTNPPYGYALQNTATVAVGYGETNKNWRKYRANYKATGLLDSSLPASYSKINLGHGSSAFLETVDLWDYYSITSATVQGGFPHYLYAVFVFTKHRNVLEAWFMRASLAQTENAVRGVLKTSF